MRSKSKPECPGIWVFGNPLNLFAVKVSHLSLIAFSQNARKPKPKPNLKPKADADAECKAEAKITESAEYSDDDIPS